MKKFSKTLVTFALGLILALSLVMSFPMVASAADGVEGEKEQDVVLSGDIGISSPTESVESEYDTIYLSTNEITVYLAEGESALGEYSMYIHMEGRATSFEFAIVMPWFVNVTSIVSNESFDSSPNSVWTSNIDESTYDTDCVRASYSGTEYFGNMTVATVNFVLATTEYCEDYPYADDAKFVNAYADDLDYKFDFGAIRICEPEKTYLMGDANLDGEVNLEDVMFIQRSIVNPRFTLSEEQFICADINHDGEVDIADCQYIQNYLIGKIDSLEGIGGGDVVPSQEVQIYLTFMTVEGEYLQDYSIRWPVGMSYMDVIEPYGEMLWEIYGKEMWARRVTSDVYGEIDVEKIDTYYVEREDKIVVYVEVEQGGEVEDSETVSISTVHEKGRDITFVVTSEEYVFVKGTVAKVIDQELGRFYIHDEDGNLLLIEDSEIENATEGDQIAVYGQIVRNVGYEVVEPALAYCKQVEIAEDMTFATVNDVAEVANGLAGYMFGAEYCVKGTIQEIYNEETGACRIIDDNGYYIDIDSLCDVNGNPFWKMDIIPEVSSVITVRAQVCKSVEAYGEKYQTSLSNGTVINCSLWEGVEKVNLNMYFYQKSATSDAMSLLAQGSILVNTGTVIIDAINNWNAEMLYYYTIVSAYYDEYLEKPVEITKETVEGNVTVFIIVQHNGFEGEYDFAETDETGATTIIGFILLEGSTATITVDGEELKGEFYPVANRINVTVEGVGHYTFAFNGKFMTLANSINLDLEENEIFAKLAGEYTLYDLLTYDTLNVYSNGVVCFSVGGEFKQFCTATEYVDGILATDLGFGFKLNLEGLEAYPCEIGGGDVVGPNEGENVSFEVWGIQVDRNSDFAFTVLGTGQHVAIGTLVYDAVVGSSVYGNLKDYEILGYYYDREFTKEIAKDAVVDDKMVVYIKMYAPDLVGEYPLTEITADGGMNEVGTLSLIDEYNAEITVNGMAYKTTYFYMQGAIVSCVKGEFMYMIVLMDGMAVIGESYDFASMGENEEFVKIAGDYELLDYMEYTTLTVSANGVAYMSCGDRFVMGFPITAYADGVLKCDGPTFSIDVESKTATPYYGGSGGEDVVAPEEGRETVNVTVYFMHRVEEGVYIKVGYSSFDIAVKEDVLVYVENDNMSAILKGYNIGGIYADEALTEAINPYASYDGQVFYFELIPVEFLGGRAIARMDADGERVQIGNLEVREDGTATLIMGELVREGWVDAAGTMITFTQQDAYQLRMYWDMETGWLDFADEVVIDQEVVNSDLKEVEGEYSLDGHQYYNRVRICASGLADISIGDYMHFYCTVSVNEDGTLHINEVNADIEIVAERGVAVVVDRSEVKDEVVEDEVVEEEVVEEEEKEYTDKY